MIFNVLIFWKLNILCRFEVYIYKIKHFFKKKIHITTVPRGTIFKMLFLKGKHTSSIVVKNIFLKTNIYSISNDG